LEDELKQAQEKSRKALASQTNAERQLQFQNQELQSLRGSKNRLREIEQLLFISDSKQAQQVSPNSKVDSTVLQVNLISYIYII